MDVDLRRAFTIARQWWWLLLAVPLIAGTVSYWTISRQQPLYMASATLQVNPPQGGSASDYYALEGSRSLADTYRELVTTRMVLEPLVAQLGLPYDVTELQSKVSASPIGDTQLIRVSVSDTDPRRSADLANAVATRFQEYALQRAEELASPYRETIGQQITAVEAEIARTEEQIRLLEEDTNSNDQALQEQIAELQTSLSQLNQTYRELILTANEDDRAAASAQTQVTVEELAIPPTAPYAPRTTLFTVLGVLVGLCLAGGAVVLLEYLDNTVKASADFPSLIGAPLLSVVGTIPKLQGKADRLFVLSRPTSPDAEAIRLLRANLEFAAAAREITTLAISSAGPSEGKSTITANLAVAMAQAGFTTVIVDADLRRPSQHQIWDVGNERGLTTLLTHPDQPWNWAATLVLGPNLHLIPSGPLPPNPADLLNIDRFRTLLDELSVSADIVLIDTPPILAVSDPLVVATKVDGVALVCRASRTRLDALRRAGEQLPQPPVRIVGAIVNQQVGRSAESYYYSSYYGPTDVEPTGAGVQRPRAVTSAPAPTGLHAVTTSPKD